MSEVQTSGHWPENSVVFLSICIGAATEVVSGFGNQDARSDIL
jgi:hypothetical protein